jgi:hypothetical protein
MGNFLEIYRLFQIFSNEHVLHLQSDKSYFFPLIKGTEQMEGGTITKDGYESSMQLSGRQKLEISCDNNNNK